MEYFLKTFQNSNLGFQSDNNIFGVGSHHKNAIVEINIQTMTLKARTLLPHKNIYWPESIPTILWPYALEAFQNN